MVLSFDTRCSLSSFIKRVEKLSKDQKDEIKKMGFGHLLAIQSQTLSKNLLVELIERWSCEKKAFELPPGELKIRLMDVALILGLRVTGEPVVLEEDLPISDLEKEYGSTIQKRSIPVSYLERRLESLKTVVTEDFVRTFLLFTFATFLFPNDCGTIDSRYLYFLSGSKRVAQFAWGKAVRQDLYEWMSKFKKDRKLRYMGSCLIFLQLWSFEHIDIARPTLPEKSLTFPRACRWQNTSSRRREWFTTKFEEMQGNQIVWMLELTSEELNFNIVRDLLKMQKGTCELSSISEHSMSDTADVEVNIREGSLALEVKNIELENTEIAMNKKLLELQEESMETLYKSQSVSANDSAGDENKLTIEEQSVESKKENAALREKNSMLKIEQIIGLENADIAISEKLVEVQEKSKEIPSTSQSDSANDSTGDENKLTLEEQIVESNKENNMLKKEIEELREENNMLRKRLLSSENFVDRFENIIQQFEDMNESYTNVSLEPFL